MFFWIEASELLFSYAASLDYYIISQAVEIAADVPLRRGILTKEHNNFLSYLLSWSLVHRTEPPEGFVS